MEHRRAGSPLRLAWAIPVVAAFTLGIGTWAWMQHRVPFDEALYRAKRLGRNRVEFLGDRCGQVAIEAESVLEPSVR